MVAVYAETLPDGNARLTTEPAEASAKPLFHALPATESTTKNESIVPLYEYRHAESGRRIYADANPVRSARLDPQREALVPGLEDAGRTAAARRHRQTRPRPLTRDGGQKVAFRQILLESSLKFG